MKIASGQPKGFLMARLLSEKTKLREDMTKERQILRGDRCLAERDTSMLHVIASKQLFFVGTELFSYLALLVFSIIDISTESWILDHDLYELNQVGFLFSKSAESDFYGFSNRSTRWSTTATGTSFSPDKWIENCRQLAAFRLFGVCYPPQNRFSIFFSLPSSYQQYAETGLIERLYRCFKGNTYSTVQRNYRIYDSLRQLLDAVAVFSDLGLPNFQTVFYVHFSVCFFVFGLFSCAALLKLVKLLPGLLSAETGGLSKLVSHLSRSTLKSLDRCSPAPAVRLSDHVRNERSRFRF